MDAPLVDRALRALFVALAVGIAWSVRGDFGGPLGAMYPGAMLGLAFAYVSGQESVARRMPILAMLGCLLIGMGGTMSYGVLHGYAKADTAINYGYGLFALLLQGGCWGLFGGGAMGLALDDRRPPWWEGLLAAVAVVGAGVALEKFVGVVLQFQVDSRGNSIVPFVGGGTVFVLWLGLRGYTYGLRGAFFGFAGFGIGMSLGRAIANATYHLPFTLNNWNIMEISCGIIGGFIFTWGMVGLPDRAEERPEGMGLADLAGILLAVVGVPLLHLALLMPADEARAGWAQAFGEIGFAAPANAADRLYMALSVVALSGAIVAGIWGVWHTTARFDWAWTPALGLTLLMILFQNLNALYYWAPVAPGHFETHHLLWVAFAGMVLYVVLLRQHEPLDIDDEDDWRGTAARWGIGSVALFALAFGLATLANGDETMTSAEMRFPPWSHRDGTPPPR